jgi:hypothetical protein
MKTYLFIISLISTIFLFACGDGGSIKFITTDHDGYAEEIFVIPENGKIKITELDANCSEVEKAGKFYHTQYVFTLGELRTVLNTECTDFKPTEFINVEKGDKIKMMIKHGEESTRYKIKYEFIKTP